MINGIKEPAFWVGVVEDRQDPLMLGRVRVRVLGLHTYDKLELPTEDLPWATCVAPITSAGVSGIGQAPIGPVEGTWVTVQYIDQDKQAPFVTGTIQGITQRDAVQIQEENQAVNYSVDKDETVEKPWDDYGSNIAATPNEEVTGYEPSDAIASIVEENNSFSPVPYTTSTGLTAIGYGSTIVNGSPVTNLTRAVQSIEQAKQLVNDEITQISGVVKKNLSVPVTQSMFDSLVLATYEFGESRVFQSEFFNSLNSGEYQRAIDYIPALSNGIPPSNNLSRKLEAIKTTFLKEGTERFEPEQNTENAVIQEQRLNALKFFSPRDANLSREQRTALETELGGSTASVRLENNFNSINKTKVASCSCPRNIRTTVSHSNFSVDTSNISLFVGGLTTVGQVTLGTNIDGSPRVVSILDANRFLERRERGYSITDSLTAIGQPAASFSINKGLQVVGGEITFTPPAPTPREGETVANGTLLYSAATVTVVHDVLAFSSGQGYVESKPFSLINGKARIGLARVQNYSNDQIESLYDVEAPAGSDAAKSLISTDNQLVFKGPVALTVDGHPQTQSKSLFFVYSLKNVEYLYTYTNGATQRQEKVVVGENVSIKVEIPLFVGQTDCCGDEEEVVGEEEPSTGGGGGREDVKVPVVSVPASLRYYSDFVKKNVTAPVNERMVEALTIAASIVGVEKMKKSDAFISFNAGQTLMAADRLRELARKEDGSFDQGLLAQMKNLKDLMLSDGYIDEFGEYKDTPQSADRKGVERERFFPNDPIGFQAPGKDYPIPTKIGEPDINRLARNERTRETIVYKKELSQHKDIPKANGKGTWNQIEPAYNAKYPFNSVYQSESGHVMEFDDTPGSERIHLYHRTGTYNEIDDKGNQVRRTVGDDYTILERNGRVYIAGNADVFVNGAKTVRVENTLDLEVFGTTTINIHQNAEIKVAGTTNLTSLGAITVKSNSNVNVASTRNINVSADGNVNISSAGVINLNTTKPSPTTGFEGIVYKEEIFPVELPPLAPTNRSEAQTSVYETPGDGTPTEVEKWKEKRIKDGSATQEELSAPPKIEETSPAASGPPPKDVKIEVPAGREFRADDKISKYFTLGDMTKGYTRKLRDKLGLTKEQIFENLCYLAENVLDPLKKEYPNLKINSGFREEFTKSQHNIGQAVDLSFPGLSRKQLQERAAEISKLIPYDQLILEYNTGGNGWIHISLRKNPGPRKQTFTMYNHKRVSGFGQFVYVA